VGSHSILGPLAAGIVVAVASVALARDLHSFRRQIGAVEVNPSIGRPTGRALAFLGQRLFYDVRLSRSGRTACASCHDPGFGFALPSRVTVSDDGRVGKRNAPALVDSGLQATLMWDGRFRSLEQQALSPFRRGEMGIGVDEAVSRLNSDREYVRAFYDVFGRRPTAAGMAKALAGYERTLVSRASRFDRFLLANDATLLTPLERDGWSIFRSRAGCSNCHQLFPRRAKRFPLFTDLGFHNLGIGYKSGRFIDAGRYRVTRRELDVGAFRTPSLRNVAITGPYMHDGSLATLEDVIGFYDSGGHPNPNLSPLVRPLFLDSYEKESLVAFLRTLTDPDYVSVRPEIGDVDWIR
jgi:cytochrome c peroxidase